jgi:DNA-binding MarR family transcriptional regulator
MSISLTIEEVKYLKELVAAGEWGRTISAAATSRREVLKRLVEAGYLVSRPMSKDTVHYVITEQGRLALGNLQWH